MFDTDPQKFLQNASRQEQSLRDGTNNVPDTKKAEPNSKQPDTTSKFSKLTSDGLNKDTTPDTSSASNTSVKSDGTQKQLELKQGQTDGTSVPKSSTSTRSFKEARQEKMGKHMNDQKSGAMEATPKTKREKGNIEAPGKPIDTKADVKQHESIESSRPNVNIPKHSDTSKDYGQKKKMNIPSPKVKSPGVPKIKMPKLKR